MHSADRAEQALASQIERIDPRSPMAPTLLLAAERLSVSASFEKVLEFWHQRSPGSVVSDARYRWELTHTRAPGAPYHVPWERWEPWRARDKHAIVKEGEAFELRLTLPIAIADGCEILDRLAGRDETSALAGPLLEQTEAVFRKDLATFVLATHAWKDTFALACLARRYRALDRMRAFAIAIAATYTPGAKRDGRVLGRRFPFHDVPLVSATSMLATGLLALGQDTALVADLAAFVREADHGLGWGDGDGAPDVLTTWSAADLLAGIDPSFDVGSASAFFEGAQQDDGTWRALGPEVPWLTDAIAKWLRDSARPFASRFRFPHLPDANRDHKTGLPYFAYFTDLSRLMSEIPGLSEARCEMAFMDLAGFRAFNNAYGQDMGDAVLRAISQELEGIADAVAIRDGGDEFLLVGAPTGSSLSKSIEAFREAWPARFVERFGADAPPVVARVVTADVKGRGLRDAREILGREVGALKNKEVELGRVGLRRDLGTLDS